MRFMNKIEISNRLRSCGLHRAAEAYREEVRVRLATAAGPSRDRAAVTFSAWEDMWGVFRPPVEKWEKKQQLLAKEVEAKVKAAAKAEAEEAKPITDEPLAPQLAGLPPFSEEQLDPNYEERDPGRQLRDSLLWAAMEWARIIRDTDDGPVVDLAAASTPPPTPFALFVLASYALSDVEKRRELIAKALAFAVKVHDPPSDGGAVEQSGGFLDAIS